MNPEVDEVFRDKISEPREDYFVEYTPVVRGMPFASVGLVFTKETPAPTRVEQQMDHELKVWLKRYRVPLFVSSFDSKGDLIHLQPYPHLMGYWDDNDKLIKRRGLFSDAELPAEQVSQAYLSEVYRDIPFRFAADVRRKVQREEKVRKATILSILVFTVVIPVVVELVSLGIEWLSRILETASLLKGFFEIGRAFGWIKPSQREKDEACKKLKMEHYFYHCEKNPAAFQRLKIANFENEEKSAILREDATLRAPRKVDGSN